ncbi:restriction endonuclease subunit S [Vibrio cholerae]|uniref:restriction endonuclease subunit S n=1 Tax=Vibrio cholerae TaxID=666 RepID=UPI001C90EA41|nr:restriction endonuclease subunit S [Vibrio cholerae]MBY3693102.1 restriction endonuclease subunit S [Vibrio cholerae]
MSGVAEVSPKYLTEAASNAVPVGYKQTEVGVIPTDWDAVCLGDVSEVRMCKRILAGQTQKIGAIPFFKIGTFGGEPDAYIPQFLYEDFKAKYSFPDKGDILISAAGTLGKSVIYDGMPAYFQDSNIVWLKVNQRKLLNEYLYHYYKVIKWASSEGSTIARLYNGIIRASMIALPATLEQTAIANALSDVDALISELERLIAKKQAIKTATMQQLLTGRTRLPQFALREDGKPKGTKPSELGEIPEDWERISIGRDTVLKARIGWQALTTKEYQTTGDIYLVTGTDFDSGAVKWERCFYVSEWRYKQDQNIQLRNDDVLITKDGTIGKVGYVTALSRPATLNSGVFVVRPKNNNLMQRFLFYVLTSRVFDDFINRITAGSTITHLYQKDFVNFEFSAPCIEEQTAIATILSDMDEEIQALEQRLGKTRQIKQGMMQELLTGKTRLLQPLNKESQHG